MSSSASTSTAGSNAAGATAAANQSGEQGGNGGVPAAATTTASSGPEGNIVEKQPNGASQGGHPEPHASSPAHQRHGGGPGGTTNTTTTGTVLRRKTNVCLICGIYTNLSLNIFEPRNGPNIVDVIYEKYKFRAERGDNADKHICFSCNNWLINWYSLQNTSSGSSRNYEPAPSTSRSSSAADSSNNSRNGGRRQHAHKPRTKATVQHGAVVPSSTTSSSNDKENYRPQKGASASYQPDQHGQISSTTSSPKDENWNRSSTHHPYSKKTVSSARRSLTLKENNGQRVAAAPSSGWNQRSLSTKPDSEDVVSSSTEDSVDPYRILVKPFESRLIQMLRGQGTSVTKEHAAPNVTGPWVPRSIDGVNGNSVIRRKISDTNGNVTNELDEQVDQDSSKEIVISFDTTLAEVIDVVPSLKAIQSWYGTEEASSRNDDPVLSLRQRLSSGSLTVSLVGSETNRSSGYD